MTCKVETLGDLATSNWGDEADPADEPTLNGRKPRRTVPRRHDPPPAL